MTEVVVDNAEQNSDSNAVAQQLSTSAGQLLRQAREAKPMSVESLASALKVPVYKLQALEEDRWDQLTDSVFTRSLALSVCRVLRIPSEPVLALLPKLEGAKLSSNPEGINAPFKEKSLRSLMSPTQEPGAGKAVKIAVALLIAIAGGAGLYFLPQWQSSEEGQAETSAEPVAEAAQVEQATIAPNLSSTPAQTVSEILAAPEAASVPQSPAVAVLEPALKEVAGAAVPYVPAVVSEPETVAKKAVAVSSGSAMRFTATGESWVQVKDAKQRVVMEKILKAGDVYEETVAGRPFQIVVGNTGVTQLEIDGAVWDLATSAKNNVARFEVK